VGKNAGGREVIKDILGWGGETRGQGEEEVGTPGAERVSSKWGLLGEDKAEGFSRGTLGGGVIGGGVQLMREQGRQRAREVRRGSPQDETRRILWATSGMMVCDRGARGGFWGGTKNLPDGILGKTWGKTNKKKNTS